MKILLWGIMGFFEAGKFLATLVIISSSKRAFNIEFVLSMPHIRGGADKSLARQGWKQATVTKLGIYSTYSPRSSIHFLARCSNFYKPLKKNSECFPSNQVSAAAMTSASDEKWRPNNCYFSPENRW